MRIVILLGVLILASITLLAAPVADQDDNWSQPVNGLQARFSFGEGEILDGTRMTQVYLELRNVSNTFNPIYLYFDMSSSVNGQVFDAAGKPVPTVGGPMDILTPFPYLLVLPWDSTLKLNVTVSGWGVPKDKKAMISLMSGAWAIDKDDTAEYFLGGTLTVKQPPMKVDGKVWTGTIEIPKARIDVWNAPKPEHPMAEKR